MTRHITKSQITPYDHMVLSAGGRTDAEFERLMSTRHPAIHCRLCALAADTLYHLVLALEARAARSAERSHLRIA